MTGTALTFSDDQADAYDAISAVLKQVGVDLEDGLILPMASTDTQIRAVIGKAGSGKTLLLAELYKALDEAGVDIVSGDWEGRKKKERRTLAILAPTNKAASVLRTRGVPASHSAIFSYSGS